MKPETSIKVDFDYVLSDDFTMPLSATVTLHHSVPHYTVTEFQYTKHLSSRPVLPEIDIMAIQTREGILWIHADSKQATLLSETIGKAIENAGVHVEIATLEDE